MADETTDVAWPEGHESVSFDLGTPRQYTARGGWNIVCECGTALGDTGYSESEQAALAESHLRDMTPTYPPETPGPGDPGAVWEDTPDDVTYPPGSHPTDQTEATA